MISSTIVIIIAVAAALIFGVVGFVLGNLYRKKTAESKIGSATEQAKKIVSDAISQAESKKKEAILEAKDEIHKQRTETERELRERRTEVQRQERRIIQKVWTRKPKTSKRKRRPSTARSRKPTNVW